MKRREFITFPGAAGAWPLRAWGAAVGDAGGRVRLLPTLLMAGLFAVAYRMFTPGHRKLVLPGLEVGCVLDLRRGGSKFFTGRSSFR